MVNCNQLIKTDFCEVLKRLHFFMGNTEKLEMLQNEPFFKLLQEIKCFYDSSSNITSLVNYNFILEIKTSEDAKFVKCEDDEISEVSKKYHSNVEIDNVNSEKEKEIVAYENKCKK